MEIEELVRDIAKYVAKNSSTESVFLTPVPETTVNSYELLDHISKVTGIEKQVIGRWCGEED